MSLDGQSERQKSSITLGVEWSDNLLEIHGERARATTVTALLGAASQGALMVRKTFFFLVHIIF